MLRAHFDLTQPLGNQRQKNKTRKGLPMGKEKFSKSSGPQFFPNTESFFPLLRTTLAQSGTLLSEPATNNSSSVMLWLYDLGKLCNIFECQFSVACLAVAESVADKRTDP